MIKHLRKIINWFSLFVVSVEKLGILNTITIFFYGRFSDKELEITLPYKLPFVFRGKIDRGVVSHFYKEGYFIEDNNNQRIEKILDGGANIGDETARFLCHYPNSQIIAVEAAKSNFCILKKNFSQRKNVELIEGALWSIETNLKVIAGKTAESFSVIETSDISDSIPAWTISHLMKKMKWDRIDILKLDIEGAEFELFTKNYEEWIHKVNAFIFEVPDNDRPGSTQAIYRALRDEDYNSYICGENLVLIRSELQWKLKKVIGFNTTKE